MKTSFTISLGRRRRRRCEDIKCVVRLTGTQHLVIFNTSPPPAALPTVSFSYIYIIFYIIYIYSLIVVAVVVVFVVTIHAGTTGRVQISGSQIYDKILCSYVLARDDRDVPDEIVLFEVGMPFDLI